MAVARPAAFNPDVTRHRHEGINGAHVRPAVDVTLHAVADPDGGGLNSGKLVRQLPDNVRGQSTDFGCPLHRNVVAQVLLKLGVAVGELGHKILINAA